MNKRWICPLCSDGINAPSKMRADDSRRFCFPCSSKAPRLVRRVCPALDRARVEKEERRKAIAKQKAETRKKTKAVARERSNAWRAAAAFMHGHDLREIVAPLWSVLMSTTENPAQRSAPEVTFHRRNYGGGLSYHHEDRVTVSMNSDLANAVETTLHELTHKAVGNKHWHNARFTSALAQAARKIWPEVAEAYPAPLPMKLRRGYGFDRALVVILHQLVKEHGPDAFITNVKRGGRS